jgi:polar amino acid transport system substrate-binding protein
MPPLPALRAALTSSNNALRACINLGNPVLAARGANAQNPTGVSVDMASALAKHLQVSLQLQVVENASASVQAVRDGSADVGFFAVDPARAVGIGFTVPYVLIEGSYLVRAASPLVSAADVDVPQYRVAVGRGSAYDLFLSRTLTVAQILRVEGAAEVMQALHTGKVEVAAGIRSVLEAEAACDTSLRLLPEPFMVIRQAMGLSTTHGQEAADALNAFVREQLASGFVQAALERQKVTGGTAARLEPGDS